MEELSDKTLVTVVIPTYNRAEKLDRALKSLVNQTVKEFKVLIVDDGSTDKTRDIVKHYNGKLYLEYIYCQNSGGPARPRNIGLFKTHTKYIAFLDSDDWWHKDKLKISLMFLGRGYSFVYHDLYLVNKKLFRQSVVATRSLDNYTYQNLLNKGNVVANSSVVTETNLLKSIGGFDESTKLIGSEDYDAWIRLSKISEKFYKIPGVYGYYWVSEDSISTYKNSIKNIAYLRKKYNLCSRADKRVGPYWLMYGYSRALFFRGKNKDARICAFLALKNKISLIVKFKILCIITTSSIKILIKY